MNLTNWQANWEKLGKEDPFWAILTLPEKKGNKWGPEEFFETGMREISLVMSEVSDLGLSPTHGKALDFGCGVGRLSQALARTFQEVHGVDISSSMIKHANRFNRWPGKCMFHVNPRDDLSLFRDEQFDFVYSNIVLQHIEPRHATQYIREFFRVLKSGGVAVFQVLEATFWRKLFPQFLIDEYRSLKFNEKPYFGMFGLRESRVRDLVREASGRIVRLRRSRSPDLSWRWVNLNCIAVKGKHSAANPDASAE
jgi:2-polyprenyl-3-methyl-5-hydroxy-6-metoxy-1,4-benzoquinol methylase